jgi:hypothetical protein
MDKSQTRRSKVKALPGPNPAHSGEFLAGWLNSDGWSYPVEAQQRLKSLLLELSGVREKAGTGMEIGEAELGPVNKLLKEYPWVLQLRSAHPSRTAKRSFLFFVNRPAGPMEQGHTWLEMILALMSSGLLDRLRTCANCGCWFYARLPKAKFHSIPCRQAHFRSTPEFQEKNKKYQGNYFRQELSVNKKYYREGLSRDEVRALKRKAKQRGKYGKS